MTREKVAYLQRYPIAMKAVHRKLDYLDRLRSMQGKITQSYDHKVTGGSIYHDRETNLISEIVDLHRALNGDLDQAIYLYKETRQVISQLDDHRLQFLLELRYIYGKTWVQVADTLELCEKTVYRLHAEALAQVVIP